jgi:Big-like domain-containing protein
MPRARHVERWRRRRTRPSRRGLVQSSDVLHNTHIPRDEVARGSRSWMAARCSVRQRSTRAAPRRCQLRASSSAVTPSPPSNNGDSSHAGSTSPVLSQTVNKASTATRVTSDSNPSKSGRTVTFTATVSPSIATGTVQFLDGSTPLGTVILNSGNASLSTSTLTVGKHSITATYSGDANFAGSNSEVLAQNVTGKK